MPTTMGHTDRDMGLSSATSRTTVIRIKKPRAFAPPGPSRPNELSPIDLATTAWTIATAACSRPTATTTRISLRAKPRSRPYCADTMKSTVGRNMYLYDTKVVVTLIP